MCKRVLRDSAAACLHPCCFNIIKLQACGRGVPDALIEFPKDSVDSRRSPPYNYKGYQDKLYPRGVRTRALRSALKGATPRVASQPRRGGGEGGPQANLVNLFVTAWRGQALTKSFNKISGPAGCNLRPALLAVGTSQTGRSRKGIRRQEIARMKAIAKRGPAPALHAPAFFFFLFF